MEQSPFDMFGELMEDVMPSKEAPLIAIVRGKTNGSIMIMNEGNGPLLNYGTEETPDWKQLTELTNEQLEYIRGEHSFLRSSCDKILSERRYASI